MAAAKFFTSEVIVANPCSDHRQVLDHTLPIDRILFHRQKFNGAAAFAQRFFFLAKSGIDQTEHDQRWAVRLGWAWTIFSWSARAAVKADSALSSSLIMRAIMPSTKRRLK